MKVWTLDKFERHGGQIRVTLLAVALGMLAVGWMLGPALWPPFKSWAGLRAGAAAPVMVCGLLDAIWDLLRRKDQKKTQAIHADINILLRELETLAVANRHTLRLSECAIKVWAVRRRSLLDCIKREKRKPLWKLAESSLLMETHSSGLRWRVGMGVMGAALEDNSFLAADVSVAWAKAEDRSEASWNSLPEKSRFGLTHSEFIKIARPVKKADSDISNGSSPSEPFVLAVPYYEGDDARGVVALGMDPKEAAAIKLGGDMDDADHRIVKLMYAAGRSALGD